MSREQGYDDGKTQARPLRLDGFAALPRRQRLRLDRRRGDLLRACSTPSSTPASTSSTPPTSIRRWAPGNKGGESETIIGKWMKARGKRDKLVHRHQGRLRDGRRTERACRRRYIRAAVEASLQRLQTDYIDLYQSHRDDPRRRRSEETLGAYRGADPGRARCARSAPRTSRPRG